VLLARLADETADDRERVRLLGRLTRLLAGSARVTGATGVLSGRWLVDLVGDVAPHLPVRNHDTLRSHHAGLTGDELAEALVRAAARTTGAVGAAGGALAALQAAAPPALLAAPVQVAAETLAVVAVELKLVAELHVVYGRAPLASRSQVAAAYVTSWISRRAVVHGTALPSMSTLLGGAARRRLRSRLARRAGRNLGTLAPLLLGAVAGAELNRRETRALGAALVADLTGRSGPAR
jgi:hypothetical protein